MYPLAVFVYMRSYKVGQLNSDGGGAKESENTKFCFISSCFLYIFLRCVFCLVVERWDDRAKAYQNPTKKSHCTQSSEQDNFLENTRKLCVCVWMRHITMAWHPFSLLCIIVIFTVINCAARFLDYYMPSELVSNQNSLVLFADFFSLVFLASSIF